MKIILHSALLLTFVFAVAPLQAQKKEHPLPPGMGRYILVLKIVDERPGTPKTITEPDVAKLGGAVLDKHDNRRIINLPPPAAKNLRGDKNVAYLQRVWMGEPLDKWDERDAPAGSSLKTHSDDVTGSSLNWSTGAFQYDPSGNIKAMGSDTYAYDSASRLVKAVVNGDTETYGYDSFGNLTQKTLAGQTSTIPAIDPASNRLAGEAYDAAGNVTTDGSTVRYEFDSVGAMSTMITKAGQRRRMIYTADDERIGEAFETKIRWKIREVNGAKVLREFQDDGSAGGGAWEWTEDYVYAGGTLVGAETEQFWGGKRHFHLDHLGSVRMITNDSKMRYSRNDYYPFGKEQSSAVQETTNFGYWRSDPMKFTGHEREYYGFSNVENGDYLDYMHARFYDPNTGRFLSVDPVLGNLLRPQSWSRYEYVLNNPMRNIDPTGLQCQPGESLGTDGCTSTVSPGSGDPWNGETQSGTARDFFMFLSGAQNAAVTDNLGTIGRLDVEDEWYRNGQLVGDGIAVVEGFFETEAGFAGEAGGFFLDATGVGALVGVPVQVASGALIVHGSATGIIGGVHLMSGIKQRKDGSLGRFKSADAKSAENKKLRHAMKAAGYGNDPDKQRLIHEARQGLPDESFRQLVKFIKDFFD